MNLVKTPIRKGKKVGYFNSYILQRIQRNKNFLCCITGGTGSGKSYSALREGEVLDKGFSIDNICFTPRQFMDLVNEKTKKLHKGSVIIYDEVQITMSHLDYQSLQAKLINYVLQTFRYRGFIMFMTSPHFSFINASVRKLFHSRMETVSIDFNKKVCSLKPFLLQINQETGDVYRKYLRVWTKETGVVPLKNIKVSIPSEPLRQAYEEKRKKFTQELNENITKDLQRLEKGDRKELTEQQKQVVLLLKEKLNLNQIANRLGINLQSVYDHIGLIKRKGVIITPIKRGNTVKYYEIQGFEGN